MTKKKSNKRGFALSILDMIIAGNSYPNEHKAPINQYFFIFEGIFIYYPTNKYNKSSLTVKTLMLKTTA